MMFDGLGSSATHIKNGRLKAIAVASDKRATGFPDIPTTDGGRRADLQGLDLVRPLGAQGHAEGSRSSA